LSEKNIQAHLSKNVSFLGMGIMGAAMAANLARKGARVKVWNRSPGRPGLKIASEAGGHVCPDLKTCLDGAELVFTCLGDVPDVQSVLTGAGGVMELAAAGTVVVDFSTIGPAAARAIALKLQSVSIAFLDAPVTGGDVGAREGSLTIMVGGDEQIFHQIEPYLLAMGKNVRFCGPSGAGQALKLANQTLCALNLVGVCEAMRMAQDLGLDQKLVVEVLEQGAGGSWALSNLGRRIVANDLQPAFAMKHMLKDLRLAFENLGQAGRLPGTRLAYDLFEKVVKADGDAAELGTQAMVRAYGQKLSKNSPQSDLQDDHEHHEHHEVEEALEGMECADRIALEWQLDGD